MDKEDIAYRIYLHEEKKKLREVVLSEFDGRCAMCENPPDGTQHGKMTLHHIIRQVTAPDRVFDVTNSVPLCERCHRKISNGREEKLAPLFFHLKLEKRVLRDGIGFA